MTQMNPYYCIELAAMIMTMHRENYSSNNMSSVRRLCIAPMLDWTDRHCRYFMRLISKHAYLYTEMITTGAILFGDADRALTFHPSEHPVALQLGGSDPEQLAVCTRIAAEYAYDEVNLNVGCPSDRVKAGRFGACLMAEPALVRECVTAMKEASALPITVKSRIGIDNLDSYEFLCEFIDKVASAGCTTFIIHARKAWLHGLSPKENRNIPSLQYDVVYRLKRDFPNLEIILNGGVTDIDRAQQHLQKVDGVMLGRVAYHNPYILADADNRIFKIPRPPSTRHEIVEQLIPYIEEVLSNGANLHHITRHIVGLYHGVRGARVWRRYLSEHSHFEGAGIEVIHQALAFTESHLTYSMA